MRFIPDSIYIQIYYFAHFKKFCDLKKPSTYNEKLNWLKLHDHNPLYPTLVDKYEAKEYVARIIGNEYIIPTLGVWDTFDDIDFEKLPNQFVLKCTHDSEGLVIVKDKKKLDKNAAKEKIEAALKQNFYYIGREWPYKDVRPRIIAEQYMEDHVDGELRDYKFFCFGGEPKAMFIASDRASDHVKFDYYDLKFNHLDIKQKYPHAQEALRKPVTFEKMIDFSKILSKGFPHVRVDFYEVDGHLYFGELTFYHFSGFMPFEPDRWDKVFGDWLKLPKV
ncbi:ATP-grasp fold amidoligase family protein [Frisingicoccus sp.]|uniref:ATP-grasp fold amidoligase family protein n=1 Tax=Frisingicoccus sp. TaxID=1918627 RepID=UPI0025C5F072|nr:ATP-grasp fold amidoligase family protein [Frisingicoccus sp.]